MKSGVSFAVEKPEIPEVLNLETGTYHGVHEVVGCEFDIAVQTRHKVKDAQIAGKPLYACAECMVPVYLVMHPQSGRFFFKHTIEDSRCSAITRGELNQDEIDARKYNGAKESRLHLSMKKMLVESLEADAWFSDIHVEKRWEGAVPSEWRKPDVQATYTPPIGPPVRVAFEVQLSTTYLDVIVERRRFYLEQGALLFWIFSDFKESGRRLTQDDVFYNNNQNAFIVNESTAQKSKDEEQFMLECVWGELDEPDGEPNLSAATVAFTELTLDLEEQKAFFFDYYGHVERLKDEALSDLQPVRDKFEASWLTADRRFSAVAGIWQELYRGLRTKGIQLPSYARDPDYVLVSALYTIKHWRVIGWRFKKVIEVAHLVGLSHPHVMPLFRLALRVYNRIPQMQAEDKSGKWAKVVLACKAAAAAGDEAYLHDNQYDEAIAILFPELFQHP